MFVGHQKSNFNPGTLVTASQFQTPELAPNANLFIKTSGHLDHNGFNVHQSNVFLRVWEPI